MVFECMQDAQKEGPVFSIRELNGVWRTVLHLGTRQHFPKSHCWMEDVDTDTFSFLNKGKVRLSSLTESGQERMLMNIEGGCIFREVGMLRIPSRHPANHIALEPCEVYAFPKALLHDEQFVRTYPTLLSNVVQSLAIKAAAFFSQLSETTQLEPREQVCRFLQRLADKRTALRFNPGISQSEMAHMLGLHRSTVCRVLRELRNEGIIGRFTRLDLEILDPDRLRGDKNSKKCI